MAIDEAAIKPKQGKKQKNYSWAQLLKRVFEVDVLICPHCGSKMRVLCAIHSPDAKQKILACLGLPSKSPPITPAKQDHEWALFGDIGSLFRLSDPQKLL
jgi:hypothetical protein